MAVTLGEARAAIRERLDEPNEGQWTDTDLDRWINEAVRKIAREAETIEDTDTVSTTAAVQDYPGPADAFRLHRVVWRPSGSNQVYPLEPRTLHTLDAVAYTHLEITRSIPAYYAAFKRPAMTIRLYPTPSVNGQLEIVYYRTPADAASDSDSLDGIPEGWHDVVYDYVEFRALRRARDPRYVDAKMNFDENMGRLINFTRHWTDQAVGQIVPAFNGGWYDDYDMWAW